MMDWIKLFTLLLVVTTPYASGEGPRKKIRIHIPQKVKHIHHHKKIYITQHPASTNYAPAFLPTADGTVAYPASSVSLPTVAGLLPLKPLPMFEERRSGRHRNVKSSPLLPMYRARGFYGPQHHWNHANFDFDLIPPPGPHGLSHPPNFEEPSAPDGNADVIANKMSPNKVVTPQKKKRIIKRKKPKRIIIQEIPKEGDEPHVSSFHEQFYADVDAVGTIQKVKKPKRVEKIIDGDTEHIHTYTEEHIHKIVFDEPKLPGFGDIDSQGHPNIVKNNALIPFKNPQNLISHESNFKQSPLYTPNIYSNLGAVGSMGTPTILEYAGYNSKDVTHDHMYHDHGHISSHINLSGNNLGTPPKASYNSHGVRINTAPLRNRNKNKWLDQDNKLKPSGPENDFSYYENLYNAQFSQGKAKPGFQQQKVNDVSYLGPSYDKAKYRLKQKQKGYAANVPSRKPENIYRNPLNGDNRYAPSSNFENEYNKPNIYSQLRETYNKNYNLDNFAASTNTEHGAWQNNRHGKKKSISTQNISFGGQDHKTVVDHLADASNIQSVIQMSNEPHTSRRVLIENDKDRSESVQSKPASEYSSTHVYFPSEEAQTEHVSEIQDASNNNFQVVEAPTESFVEQATTTENYPHFMEEKTTQRITEDQLHYSTSHTMKIPKKIHHNREAETVNIRPKEKLTVNLFRPSSNAERLSKAIHSPVSVVNQSAGSGQESTRQKIVHIPENRHYENNYDSKRGKLKYGDKLYDS